MSFRHMQVMFTSSSGKVLEPNNFRFDASVGGTALDRDGYEDSNIMKIGPGEKITYLYRLVNFSSSVEMISTITFCLFSRVAEGLSLDSHAAKCAELFGVPMRIVERAQRVSHLLSTHELGQLLDEGMSEAERLELEEAEVVCRRFLKWDLKAEADSEDDGVKAKLGHILGRDFD